MLGNRYTPAIYAYSRGPCFRRSYHSQFVGVLFQASVIILKVHVNIRHAPMVKLTLLFPQYQLLFHQFTVC